MQKHIRLWEVLSAVAALCVGFGTITWNIYTMAIESKKDIIYNNTRVDKIEARQDALENKWDARQDAIQQDLQSIRILIENKQNRK